MGVLVTGGGGYIGSHMVWHLVDAGEVVVVLDDFSTGFEWAVAPEARIVVLTTYDGDEDIFRALQAGAKGYMLKGMPFEELLTTIRAVHRGKARIPSPVAEKLAERIVDGAEFGVRLLIMTLRMQIVLLALKL